MLNFLKRLFGHPSYIVKDKVFGRLVYLESEHGNVWAGGYSDRKQKLRMTIFIRADEPLFDGDIREYALSIIENLPDINTQLTEAVTRNYPGIQIHGPSLDFLTIHPDKENPSAELLYTMGDLEIGATLKDLTLEQLSVYQ